MALKWGGGCAALPTASPAAVQCLLLQAGVFSAGQATRLIQDPREVGKWWKEDRARASRRKQHVSGDE